MRSPRCFMATSSMVVTGLGSSAIVELRQLALPEGAVRKLGVRDHEGRLTQHTIAETHDVQVQGPRSPTNPRLALAAALRFDRVEVDEQLGGLERGFEQDHLVEVCPLRHGSEGVRLLDLGLVEQAGAR